MKIGIDITFIIQDKRGMGRYARNVIREFLKYKAFDFSLVSSRSNLNQVELKKIFPSGDWSYIFSSEVKKIHLDLVWHIWNRIDFLSSGKNIVNIYDTSCFRHFPYENLAQRDRKKDQTRLKKAANISDRIITISQFSKGEINKYLKVPLEKIKVVYPGTDRQFKVIDFTIQEKVSFKEKFTKGFPFVLYIGSPDPRKNLKGLLEAFSLLKRKHSLKHKLIIITEKISPSGILDKIFFKKRLKNNIFHLLKSLDLEGEVFLYSELTDEDLVKFYNLADLFVFPSFYEGFGIPVLEAMATGTPVVCAKSSSLTEIGEGAAVLVNPYEVLEIAEGVKKVLEDKRLAERLKAKGLEKAKEFSWYKCAKEILDCFREIAG